MIPDEPRSFVAFLPLPHQELSPNARPHWAAKAARTKAGRREAWYWFRRYLPEDWIRVPVRLEVTYHCPKGSRGYCPRDIANAMAAMKPMVDGMVDAGVIPDDSHGWLEWGPFTLSRRKNGDAAGVRITVIAKNNAIPEGAPAARRGLRNAERQRSEVDAASAEDSAGEGPGVEALEEGAGEEAHR